MFCLRSWVPLLIFLTNAAPIYVILFLTATYALQRPCVYCSILLFVLVFSLFDFGADWFEPRWTTSQISTNVTEAWTSAMAGNATILDAIGESAGVVLSALNGTGGSLASSALTGVKERFLGGGAEVGSMTTEEGSTMIDWLKNMIERRQFRIPCVDVLVRL